MSVSLSVCLFKALNSYNQGSKGIIQFPMKLMYLPDDDTQNYPSVDYIYLLKRLDTELFGLTNNAS